MTKTKRETIGLLLFAIVLAGTPPASSQPGQSTLQGESVASSEIRGKITITRKEESHKLHVIDPFLGRYSTQGRGGRTASASPPAIPPQKLSDMAVIYLESDELNQRSYPVPDKNPVLDQENLQFHPQVLPILVGTTVDFPNRDNLFHNVFSYSQAKEFDLGRYPRNDSRSVTFDKPGLVRVYCDIHSHMNATIIVLSHPYFATLNDDGTYAIPRIPEGKYRVVFWYDRNVVERRTVELRAGESTVMDFTF